MAWLVVSRACVVGESPASDC